MNSKNEIVSFYIGSDCCNDGSVFLDNYIENNLKNTSFQSYIYFDRLNPRSIFIDKQSKFVYKSQIKLDDYLSYDSNQIKLNDSHYDDINQVKLYNCNINDHNKVNIKFTNQIENLDINHQSTGKSYEPTKEDMGDGERRSTNALVNNNNGNSSETTNKNSSINSQCEIYATKNQPIPNQNHWSSKEFKFNLNQRNLLTLIRDNLTSSLAENSNFQYSLLAGYHLFTEDKDFLNSAEDLLRIQVEACNLLQGFQLYNNYYEPSCFYQIPLLEYINDEYGKKYTLAINKNHPEDIKNKNFILTQSHICQLLLENQLINSPNSSFFPISVNQENYNPNTFNEQTSNQFKTNCTPLMEEYMFLLNSMLSYKYDDSTSITATHCDIVKNCANNLYGSSHSGPLSFGFRKEPDPNEIFYQWKDYSDGFSDLAFTSSHRIIKYSNLLSQFFLMNKFPNNDINLLKKNIQHFKWNKAIDLSVINKSLQMRNLLDSFLSFNYYGSSCFSLCIPTDYSSKSIPSTASTISDTQDSFDISSSCQQFKNSLFTVYASRNSRHYLKNIYKNLATNRRQVNQVLATKQKDSSYFIDNDLIDEKLNDLLNLYKSMS